MIVVLLACVIFIKLFNLQVVNGVTYRKQSENRLLRSHPITATRGEITDRFGRPLVTSRMGFDLIAYKEYIDDNGSVSGGLHRYLKNLPEYKWDSLNNAKYRVIVEYYRTKDDNDYLAYSTFEVKK